MSVAKVRITEELADELRELRKSHPVNGIVLTAQDLSFAIKKPRVWMSQIESPNKKGKKFVKIADLNLVFETLLGKDAYKTDEYRDFMARHADNIPTDYTLWQNHKSFMINPRLSATVDYDKAVHAALKEFDKSFNQLIKQADNVEKKFIVLRSLNMLNRNLQRVPDLALVLNTTPLFACGDNAAFSHNVTKHMLSLLDECVNHLEREPASYDVCSMPWAKDAIKAVLSHIEEAVSILKTMLSNEREAEKLKKTYNEHLGKIDSIYKALFFPLLQVAPIADDKCIDVALICDHIKEMDSVKKKLTTVLDNMQAEYDKYEEWRVSQMVEENSPEYQQDWTEGYSTEHWNALKVQDKED